MSILSITPASLGGYVVDECLKPWFMVDLKVDGTATLSIRKICLALD
jgi:hypothetical protein